MSKSQIAAKPASSPTPAPQPVHTFPRLRVLAWHRNVLFASHAYTLLSADFSEPAPHWSIAGFFRPAGWRNLTSSARLSLRLFGDGFYALAVLPTGHLVASVPGAIISLAPGDTEFHVTHEIKFGRPPQKFVVTDDRKIFWSGHVETSERSEACLYTSPDRGLTWEVVHPFPRGVAAGIRGLVHEEWDNCLWIFAEDEGPNCKVFRASLDFQVVEVAISGREAQMAACVPTRDAIYFGTHLAGANHILRLRRNGSLIKVASIDGPVLCGCQVGNSILFSTVAKANSASVGSRVKVCRSPDGDNWEEFLQWKKDFWPDVFQSGCAFLAEGNNSTDLLAVTTVAVAGADLEMTLWRI